MLPKLKYQWNVFARLLLIGILIAKVSAGTLGLLTYEIIGGTEVVKVKGEYHIFNGDTFFDGRSGYRLILKANAEVDSCEFDHKFD